MSEKQPLDDLNLPPDIDRQAAIDAYDEVCKTHGVTTARHKLIAVAAISALLHKEAGKYCEMLDLLPPAKAKRERADRGGADDIRERIWKAYTSARAADEIEARLYPDKRQERIAALEGQIAELRAVAPPVEGSAVSGPGQPSAPETAPLPSPRAGTKVIDPPLSAIIGPRETGDDAYPGFRPAPGDPPPPRPPVVIEGEVASGQPPAASSAPATEAAAGAGPSTPRHDPVCFGLQRPPETEAEKAEKAAALARANAPVDPSISDTRPQDPASTWARGNGGGDGGYSAFDRAFFRREW